MEKILISACLLGERVKYHGGHALVENSTLDQWRKEERLVIICPEVSAGFPTPRRPSEIIGGGVREMGAGDLRVLRRIVAGESPTILRRHRRATSGEARR